MGLKPINVGFELKSDISNKKNYQSKKYQELTIRTLHFCFITQYNRKTDDF